VAIVADDDLPDAAQWTPWIASMIVRPDFRGQGRGQHLLDAALQRGRDIGITKIHLWTEHREAWYSRLGWAIEEEREFRGVPITVMSFELN
jgi:N-acetylglutamate synthase-like GNAT family acetyltransferase